MKYLKENYLKILVLGLFLLAGLFLANDSLVKKFRDLNKSVSDKLELIYVLSWQAKNINLEVSDLEIAKRIAHAGGGIDEMKYTNSLEALNESYKNGFRFIEMDISWTHDKELVMLHGWESEIEGLFGEKKGIRSLEEFKNFEMVGGLTQMSFDDVAQWLRNHKDAYLVTDVKNDNILTLDKIKEEYPDLQSRIIPQIYFFKEYSSVVDLGYNKVIFTLYDANYHPALVAGFIDIKNIFALAMPTSQIALNKDLISKAKDLDIPIFTHTIDSKKELVELENLGIYGVYTNFLGIE